MQATVIVNRDIERVIIATGLNIVIKLLHLSSILINKLDMFLMIILLVMI